MSIVLFQKVAKKSKSNIDIGFPGHQHVLTQVFYDKGEIDLVCMWGSLAFPKDVDTK